MWPSPPDSLSLKAEAADEYEQGPWQADCPVERIFVFTSEVAEQAAGAAWRTPPAAPTLAAGPVPDGAQPGAEQAGPQHPVETRARRRIAARIGRALDALEATRLWRDLPEERRVDLLTAGGEGTGSVWTSTPATAAARMTSAQWSVATALRLGILRRPCVHATCQLP